jgi:sugar lactone lactonase YvrE
VAAVIRVGGVPDGAAFGAGVLWVADFNGTVVRIDPVRRRVVGRIRLDGQPDSIAVGTDGLWVRVLSGTDRAAATVEHLDPRTGRVLARTAVGAGSGVAVGGRAVWAPRRFFGPEGIDRIDRARGVRTGRLGVRNVDGVVEAGGVLWVAVHDGTIVQIDAATGRVVRRWPALAPSEATASGTGTIVADDRGAWVLSTHRAEILRLAGGRVVRRIAVDPTAQPLLTRVRGALWIAAGGGPTAADARHNRVTRIDPDSGRATATVDTGDQRPVALVAAGGELLVVTAQGRVLVVRS